MNDALRVGSVQGVGDFNGHIEQLFHIHRALGNGVFQGLAFQKLHGNESLSVLFANVVNSANVGMIECRGSMCFTLKASQRPGITCKFRAMKRRGRVSSALYTTPIPSPSSFSRTR